MEKKNGKLVVFGLLAIVLLISYVSVLIGRKTRESKPSSSVPAVVEEGAKAIPESTP